MRMQGQNHVLPVFHILVHVFDLARVDVRHGHFHRCREVDDRLPVRSGLPYIQYGVADLQCVFRLGSGEAFGGILKPIGCAVLVCQTLQKLGTVRCDLLDLVF